MRADTATVLEAMAFIPFLDFRAIDKGGGVQITWLSQQVMPSEAEIDAYDLPAANLQKLYAQAKVLLTADDPISKKEKALLLVILDEFNAHASKINAILTAIDGAASFAAMKTAIAAIVDYPQRTPAQIKTAVAAKIDAGQADG